MKPTFKFEDGEKHETHASVKRRIASKFGFQPSKIILMEGSEHPEHEGYVYDHVSFQVCGLGYACDFDQEQVWMDPAYNATRTY